jgi:hypothetical protein
VTDGARTRDLSRATIRRLLLPGVAVCCRIGLEKPISLHEIAHCFCALCAEWCQGGVDRYKKSRKFIGPTFRSYAGVGRRTLLRTVGEELELWTKSSNVTSGRTRGCGP